MSVRAPSESATPAVEEQICPQCGGAYPVQAGFVPWCDRCGWGLKPPALPRARSPFAKLYVEAGRRAGGALLAEMRRGPVGRPRLTPALAAAFALAVLVHGVTLGLVGLGVALLAGAWGYWIIVAVGLLCLGLAWVIRPRAPRLDAEDRDGLVTRAGFPALFALTDRVAAALGARPVETIVLTGDFNAAYGAFGWRRRPVLFIGLPLFSILDDAERVSLLGHELAHGVNGDPTRGFVVGTAIDSLTGWYRMLHPGRIGGGIIAMCSQLIMLALARVVLSVALALVYLLSHTKQRAEYLADALGARAGGTPAVLRLLEKLHLGHTFVQTRRRVALTGGADFFAEWHRQAATVPARELARIRRVQLLEGSRLDHTHPPTAYRVAVLEAHPVATPAVTVTPEQHAALERELATVHPQIHTRLMDRDTSRLYD
jgi:heat shock protein HtpX